MFAKNVEDIGKIKNTSYDKEPKITTGFLFEPRILMRIIHQYSGEYEEDY